MTEDDDARSQEEADGDESGSLDTEAEENTPDLTIDADAFTDAIQDIGRPVVTASRVAQVLDCTQGEASDALTALAADGPIKRLDVSEDPVVWYPTDWSQLTDRERVIVFPGRREIVVDHPTQFTRAQLSQFAHLVDTTHRGGYLYEIRREDIWNAPYEDFDGLLTTFRDVLPERSPELEEWLEDQWKRAHQFSLRTHEDGYVVLEAATENLMGNVAREKLDDGQLRAPISDSESWVAEESVAEVKRILYEAGYPVQDERDLDTGEALDLQLDLELRDYQHEWVSAFLDRKAGVLVGPPGSGKTVAAMGILERVGGETLILVPGRELASQWKDELLARTTLEPDQVGEYHGGTKEVRPVTIATYQTAGMDRHRELFDSRGWGLIVYDECLAAETIVETPGGRTTLSEIDDRYQLDSGWNTDPELSVKTYDPSRGEFVFDDVTGVYKTTSTLHRIETNTGHSIRATPEHTHLVFDVESGEVIEQAGVSEGEFLLRPTPNVTKPSSETESTGHAMAELMGWFIGDGHANEYDDIKFSFAKRPEEQIALVQDCCDRLGIEYSIFDNERGDITIWIPDLVETIGWEGETGDKTASVTVPSECYNWGPERIGRLLRGLFDAEGSVDKKSRIQFNSVSEGLATDVAALLQKLGIDTRYTLIQRDGDRHNDVHRLIVPSFYADRFKSLVGFNLEHKSARLESGASPATGLPAGPLLERLKAEFDLSNRELGDMANCSRQTIGDVIRGRYRLGQHRLPEIASALRAEFHLDDSPRPALAASGRTLSGDDQSLRATLVERLELLEHVTVLEVTDVHAEGRETVYDLETESHTFVADGFLTHNCHHIPAAVYRRSADLQSRHRLGLSSTPVRESDDEEDIYTLIGQPIGTDWDSLFDAGFVAEPEVEIRYVPWADDDTRNQYVSADGHERRQLAATNPAKVEEVRQILSRHPEKKALVFVEYIDQGEQLAAALESPFISGEMPHSQRQRHLQEFRQGTQHTLVVSRVGDEGIDLPDAELAVVASGLGGSRRQGAQRAGRTMRPTGQSLVYVLATRGSNEEEFAQRRMRHLASKGVRVSEADAEPQD